MRNKNRTAYPQSSALLAIVFSVTALSSCGGGGGDSSTPPSTPAPTPIPPAATYSVTAQVTGLTGYGLVISNGMNSMLANASGAWRFSSFLATGASYDVRVSGRISNPRQTCTVANGSGTIQSADVTVQVTCANVPLNFISANPANNATNVSRSVLPVLTFSEWVDAISPASNAITLQSAAGAVPISTRATGTSDLTITPTQRLARLTEYTLSVSTAVRGHEGELLANPVSTRFTTTGDRMWGRPRGIEATSSGDTFPPIVAMDASGNGLALWLKSDGEVINGFARRNAWASRFTAGVGWSAPTLLETNEGTIEFETMAANAAGYAVAVWRQHDGTRYNVWANRFVPGMGAGTGWGTAVMIEASDDFGGGAIPQVAVDAAGNAIAVWTMDSGIMSNRYTMGVGWGSTVLLTEPMALASSYDPSIGIDGSGNATLVFPVSIGVTSTPAIWARRYTSAGWSAAIPLEPFTAGVASSPAKIAVNASGEAMALWVRRNAANINTLWASRYTSAGWSAASSVTTSDVINNGVHQIAIDSAGNAMAVWVQGSTTANILFNRYTVGTGWGTATSIRSDVTESASGVKLAFDGSNNAVAVWQQADPAVGCRVWSSRYGTGAWAAPTRFDFAAQGCGSPSLSVNAAGNAVAAWSIYDFGSYEHVWANEFE
jgi:hypothetical protein